MEHKNIRTTQIYVKITLKKLSHDADLRTNRLNAIEQFKSVAI